MPVFRQCSLINDCANQFFPFQGHGSNMKLVVELAICIILWHEKSPNKHEATIGATDNRTFFTVIAT